MDLKTIKSAIEQLEEERKIPRGELVSVIEQALAAAYKKEYGKKGQIVRARFDADTGEMTFEQVKIVVDETTTRIVPEGEEEIEETSPEGLASEDVRPRFNSEHHILLKDAKKIKSDAKLEDEIVFPLETKADYGRIAAQTAKQVIIQKIREAEKGGIMTEFKDKEGEIVSGTIQRSERGLVYIDLARTTAIMPYEEQIPGERLVRGGRIRALLYEVTDTPRGVTLRLSRSHPKFLQKLFEGEVPEILAGTVEIKAVAREAGSRSKIAVSSLDPNVDPVGSCVGQRGVRVSAVMSDLSGEKIDIIPWSEDPAKFIAAALLPAKVLDIQINEDAKEATIEVPASELSLAIGKGGQNVRLAAKLTGYRIDIRGAGGETLEEIATKEEGADEKEKEIPTVAEELQEADEKAAKEE
jgi:N utilization substance protein A